MARLGGVAFKSGPHKDKHKSSVCKGLNSGGPNKGRLKKGFKWVGNSACPVPAATAAAPKKRKRKAKATTKGSAKACDGLVSSGKKKGKLKKGFKWVKNRSCPTRVKAK